MRTTGYSSRKKEPEKPSTGFRIFSFFFFIAIVAAAYFASGFVIDQVDLGDLLETQIPVINKTIPEWVFQLVFGVIIFLVLQFLAVFVFGLFSGRKKNLDPPEDLWRGQY